MPTKFAPPERLSATEIATLAGQLRSEILLPWLDGVPVGVLVLNSYRQIVFCNEAFRQLAQKELGEVLGLRPGEALGCIHSRQEPGGCGCSESCRHCGAALAILKSLRGEADCQECRMLRRLEGADIPMDLQVFTRPVDFGGGVFSLLTAVDIGHEKRLRYLERTMYHDLINLAGGMNNLADLMDMDCADHETMALFAGCTRRLLGEVLYHRDLAAAEAGNLSVTKEAVALPEFLARIAQACNDGTRICSARVRLDVCCASVDTDRRLLGHVLRNMLQNALDAAPPGSEVVLACREGGGFGQGVLIRVENPGEMPPEIRNQLFKRYVSTRGPDRGLGTYVMRLLTEKYLCGRIAFESANGRTSFTLEL